MRIYNFIPSVFLDLPKIKGFVIFFRNINTMKFQTIFRISVTYNFETISRINKAIYLLMYAFIFEMDS